MDHHGPSRTAYPGNHFLGNFVESMLTSNSNEVLHQVQHSAILENSVYHDHPEIYRQMPVRNVGPKNFYLVIETMWSS